MCENRSHHLRVHLILSCLLLATSCAGIHPRSLEEALHKSRPLDEGTVVAGLKEALKVGSQRSVDGVSVLDGFLGNGLIRIAIPEEFEDVARAMRSAGFDRQVEQLEVAMNRAAEQAAGEARDVFWGAISGLSIADGFAILRGPEDAATRYFRTATEGELRQRFEPIVQQKMGAVGLYRIYHELTGYYERIPFVRQPALNLEAYVVDRTLDGLFTVLALEEQRIREDPAARSSELLRRVFGR